MMNQFLSVGADILAIGNGSGSTLLNRNKYITFGLGNYGTPSITTSYDVKSFLLDEPAEHRRDITKEQLGEFTYYGVCAGCNAMNQRLIGVPTNIIQAIHMNNPQGIVDYINNPKNLRDDYLEMPPQNYLSEEAKMAVAEYILNMKK
jgi:hypothetical protein